LDIDSLTARFSTLFAGEQLARDPTEWGWRIPHQPLDIRWIGYATTLTPEVVLEARERGVQLIITHHDVWSFMFEMREQVQTLLEDFKIAHLFVHAPLDDADFGTSASLLKLTGCSGTGRFYEEDGFFWGRLGELAEALPLDDFERRLSGSLGEAPRQVLPASGMVGRVGVVAGAGNMNAGLRAAVESGCDTYLTGEMTLYFLLYARHSKLNTLVYTHNYTEIHGVRNLVQALIGDQPGLEAIRLAEEHF